MQSLVKLFALACKSERDGRAAELAGLVTSAKGIQMMCNYAAKLKKSTLADKVAAKGRENVSLNEGAMSSSSVGGSQEDPAPRRMSIKRKAGVVQQRPVGNSHLHVSKYICSNALTLVSGLKFP